MAQPVYFQLRKQPPSFRHLRFVPSTDLGVHIVRFVCGQAARVGRTSPELLAKYGLSPDERKFLAPMADAATSIAA
jgi:hypothetical protein